MNNQAETGALRQTFLDAMSRVASTVNVVTTDGPAGRAGVTVSAMASVSADTPAPSLLICVNHASAAAPVILRNGVLCVNILRDDQTEISDVFAGRVQTSDGDKFSCTQWVNMSTGSPRIIGPLAAFDCRMVHAERHGTHHVIFGEIEEIFLPHTDGLPLLYGNRSYGTLSPFVFG